MQQFRVGDICVDVVKKDIKNIHLSVYPPLGRVRISAPLRMDLDTLRVFTVSKLGWIKKQQRKLLAQKREAPRVFLTRESHYYLGRRYLLKIIEHDAPSKVEIKHETLKMSVRPNTDTKRREEILDEWYRQKLKEIAPKLIARFEEIMKVQVAEIGVKKMKTKWGSCSIMAKRIWLNLELAKKSRDSIEYIVVHEMVHLLERHHNEKFVFFMDRFLPKWRFYKEELNRTPLRHEN